MLKQIRQLLSMLSGKSRAQVEDYVLEHLLAYHSLIGTGANDQPEFRELASAITQAVSQQSATQLSSALKVPPLWWEEHLQPLFSEMVKSDPERLARVLAYTHAADSTGSADAADLLFSDDWRVRANAANALTVLYAAASNTQGTTINAGETEKNAADVGVTNSFAPAVVNRVEGKLAESLADCTKEPFKAAFIHIAYALGKLQTDTACKILLGYLHDPEPWFRVDAARALSLFPMQEAASDLLDSLLDYHVLLDYESVVIARAYGASSLLRLSRKEKTDQGRVDGGGLNEDGDNEIGDSDCKEGICELVLGALQAATQSVFSEVPEQTDIADCLPKLLAAKPVNCSARRIRAVLQLSRWLKTNKPTSLDLDLDRRLAEFIRELRTPEFLESIKHRLERVGFNAVQQQHIGNDSDTEENADSGNGSDTRHTIVLVGELYLSDLAPLLLRFLNPKFVAFDETIETLGALGNTAAVQSLVNMAQQLVDVKKRADEPLSAQPVLESEPNAAKSYWLILKALGHLPHPAALQLLYQAAYDFAPDKRFQALESLSVICKQSAGAGDAAGAVAGGLNADQSRVQKIFAQALIDPSVQVRLAALHAVAELQLVSLLPAVRKNCGAKERSLSKEAFAVFRKLYEQGYAEPVLRELKNGATWSMDSNLRQRYAQLLSALAG